MTEEQVQETTQEVSKENTTEVQIPEYIPEKFWDIERNEIKVEELGASYKALEQKLGMRTEDLVRQVQEDYENQRKSSVPESDNARERIEAADLWSKKYLSTDSYDVIANLASTAEGVKALEEIMSLSRSKPLPNTNTVIDVELDERDLQSMMKDPRYWKEGMKDPAYIAKVTNLYQKKYG
jgi:hypothetical protein